MAHASRRFFTGTNEQIALMGSLKGSQFYLGFKRTTIPFYKLRNFKTLIYTENVGLYRIDPSHAPEGCIKREFAMKFNYLVVIFILLPLDVFSHSANAPHQIMSLSPNPIDKNTQTITYSNESQNLHRVARLSRSIDYPTQIIRMKNNIEKQQTTCEEVHNQINNILINNIANDQFMYAFSITCHYDPNTFLATHFSINSYFDPVNDEAITFLKTYLSEYNGASLLGTKLKIESARGLIISLSVAAGMKKNPAKPPFTEYRRDRSNFYFKSNYEMKNKLFTDVYENFYSNSSDKILPFMDRWLFANASSLYKAVLRDSNYVELQPERIFLMENDEEIFVSGLKQYFMHHCEKYENHRCLKPT